MSLSGIARGQRIACANGGCNARVFLAHLPRKIFTQRFIAARHQRARFKILIEESERGEEVRIARGARNGAMDKTLGLRVTAQEMTTAAANTSADINPANGSPASRHCPRQCSAPNERHTRNVRNRSEPRIQELSPQPGNAT